MLLFLLRLNPYVCWVPFTSDCEILTLRMMRLWWRGNRHSRGCTRGIILHIILVPRLHGRHFFRSILLVLFLIVITLLPDGFLSDLAGRLGNSPFLQTTSQLRFTIGRLARTNVFSRRNKRDIPRIEVLCANLLDHLLQRPFFVFVQTGDQRLLLLPDIRRYRCFHCIF